MLDIQKKPKVKKFAFICCFVFFLVILLHSVYFPVAVALAFMGLIRLILYSPRRASFFSTTFYAKTRCISAEERFLWQSEWFHKYASCSAQGWRRYRPSDHVDTYLLQWQSKFFYRQHLTFIIHLLKEVRMKLERQWRPNRIQEMRLLLILWLLSTGSDWIKA